MSTVADTQTARKPLKLYRAILREEPGTLTKLAGTILFFGDDGTIHDIEPLDCVWLCVLGEIGLSEAQKLADTRHGGYAQVACSRLQEVR